MRSSVWRAASGWCRLAALLVLVVLVSNDRAAMGERTNGRLLNVVGWVTTIVMAVAAIRPYRNDALRVTRNRTRP